MLIIEKWVDTFKNLYNWILVFFDELNDLLAIVFRNIFCLARYICFALIFLWTKLSFLTFLYGGFLFAQWKGLGLQFLFIFNIKSFSFLNATAFNNLLQFTNFSKWYTIWIILILHEIIAFLITHIASFFTFNFVISIKIKQLISKNIAFFILCNLPFCWNALP